MAQQAAQPGASELDANIDALFNQLEPGAGGSNAGGAGEPPVTLETAVDPVMSSPVDAPVEMPAAGGGAEAMAADAAGAAGAMDAPAEQPDAMLAEVSREIEREAAVSGAGSGLASAAAVPEAVGVGGDLDSAFEAPRPEELRVEPVAPAHRPASAPSAVNIEKLDAALAANADKALAAAQQDLEIRDEPAAAAVAPAAAPVAKAAAVASAPVAAAVKAAEPEEVIPELPGDEPVAAAHAAPAVPVVVAEPKTPVLERVLTPLRPLAVLHERLGESTRQTIAYSAILTLFAAACAWTLPRFAHGGELQPATGETPFIKGYDDTAPAHGVKAPPKAHSAEKKAEGGHGEGGEGGGGHGEAAKKDSHAKAPKKKEASGGHGEEGGGHGAEKAKKASTRTSKKAPKADEHGGGH